MKTVQQQFADCNLIKVFEIAVIDKRTAENTYIIFDIKIEDNKLVATHEALTTEQKNSNKIAYVCIDIDDDFSLDSNLNELHESCVAAILESDFFELL